MNAPLCYVKILLAELIDESHDDRGTLRPRRLALRTEVRCTTYLLPAYNAVRHCPFERRLAKTAHLLNNPV